MTRAKSLAAGLALAVLLVAGAGVSFAYGQMGSIVDDQGMSEVHADQNGMSSMMGEQSMSGGMMGSFYEEQPFDLQFIDQMIMHHEGAIMSSEHMIADSERPELRQLAENIQQSQSEQIEQM